MGNFSELISSPMPVIVDFYADWCGPCQAMSPMISELAAQMQGKARIVKVNIDKNKDAARFYNIESVPTFIIFKAGRIVWRHSGTLDKTTLQQQIAAFS
ncbi:MAG TPA: thioredoxin [Bacteroidia bacterium]|nr:thioredoxin [Bacteroidia bacterium]